MESILSLFKAEPYSKEFEINGVKAKLRVLTSKEFDEIMARANISLSDLVSKRAMIRRPILSYSLVSLNGAKVEDFKDYKEIEQSYKDKKEEYTRNMILEELLGKFDSLLVDSLYSLYETLEQEKAKELEEVKKA